MIYFYFFKSERFFMAASMNKKTMFIGSVFLESEKKLDAFFNLITPLLGNTFFCFISVNTFQTRFLEYSRISSFRRQHDYYIHISTALKYSLSVFDEVYLFGCLIQFSAFHTAEPPPHKQINFILRLVVVYFTKLTAMLKLDADVCNVPN